MNYKLKHVLGIESQEEKREKLLKELVNIKEIDGKIYIVLDTSINLLKLPVDMFKEEDVCTILNKIREINS
jgi:hypothetical protein